MMATNKELEQQVKELSEKVARLQRVLIEVAAAANNAGYLSPGQLVAIRKAGML